MTANEYSRMVIDLCGYATAYAVAAARPADVATIRSMANASSHAMQCGFELAEHHQGVYPNDPDAILAWLHLAKRWMASTTKWAGKLPSNESLAYTRVCAERKGLLEWPRIPALTKADLSTSSAACGEKPETGSDAGESSIAGASPAGCSTAASIDIDGIAL